MRRSAFAWPACWGKITLMKADDKKGSPAEDPVKDMPGRPGRPGEPETPETAPPPAPNPDERPPEGGPSSRGITWTASEFIAHSKSAGWYAVLGLGALIFASAVYLVSRDYVSVGVILIAAILLGVYAGHKPRQIEYGLDSKGLDVGERHFGYGEFRSFSVIPEGAISTIVFMPLKRFAATTTIYYPPEDEDSIVSLLSDHLPMEDRRHDAVDRLMHRIRY